ncbi:FAD-dependent oxidoreductase [Streptomyces sparsogenes]|uniref:FAD-dependent oxidoreductase n=1 Tax=Streptomyces sparsogenes TaxID=67365 RepID=UPI0033C23781
MQAAQRGRLWPEVPAATAERSERAARSVEWEPKGGIVIATSGAGAQEPPRFAAAQREAGVRAEVLDGDALARAEPFVTRDHTAAMYYPDDAQVQPAGASAALPARGRASSPPGSGHRSTSGPGGGDVLVPPAAAEGLPQGL